MHFMAGLLFYFPKAGPKNDVREWFAQAGLGELLVDGDDRPAFVSSPMLSGPDGGQGRVAYWTDPRGQRAPNPAAGKDRCTWHAAPAEGELPAGRAWIGWETDRPPTPEDLRRKNAPPGVPLELGRFTWEIPIARDLPQTFGGMDGGRPVWRFEFERHRLFFEETRRLVEPIVEQLRREDNDGGRFEWNVDEHLTFTLRALEFGYRVNPWILAALNCIRNEGLYRAAWIAAGMPAGMFEVKKSSADTGSGVSA